MYNSYPFIVQSEVRRLLMVMLHSSPQQNNTKSEFYTSFCGRPQANLHRAADIRKKIAPADTEKCPQKSAGFDRGTDICGFVADICGLPQ